MSNPLLIFPKPTEQLPRESLSRRNLPTFFGPSKDRQKGRFDKKISSLNLALGNEAITLSQSVIGLEPERLLVLEIKGEIEDFYKAVEKTEGMEFLGESYLGDDEPDKDYVYRKLDENDKIIETEKKIARRLFLTLNNLNALNELKKYWDDYQNGTKYKSGTTKFRILFEQLNDVRYYSVKDRYEDTGILDYFYERLELKVEEIYFEIELTYRNNEEYLKKVYTHLKGLIEASGGELIESSYTIIPEIKYHAIIARVPIELFHELKEDTNVTFFKCEQILFFRPVGQSVLNQPIENSSEEVSLPESSDNPIGDQTTIIALLDGLPLQNHSLLQGKIIVDDPENLEEDYPSNARLHGTSMASLILYGDLNSKHTELSSKKLYIRPILYPVFNSFTNAYDEVIPNTKLFIDIIHSSIKRIMEGAKDVEPLAPDTKIINLSIGDYHRPFLFNNSSWARLIDWLANKYDLLFIISAGNYTEQIELEIGEANFTSLSESEKEELFLSSLIKDNFKRKILAPAESINSITVGAYYSDEFDAVISTNNFRVELLSKKPQISPISRIGMGYLNSIKPDILVQGGRQLYRSSPLNPKVFKIDNFGKPPGHKVAYPDANDSNKGINFTRGTSNSAALATRFAGRIYEVLDELSFESLTIPQEYYSVIIKSLLVHGASQGNTSAFYQVLGENNKTKILPYIGHGFITDESKVLSCTEQQVTLIGYGELGKDESHSYELPLPNKISSLSINKQLTITLAWFSPINFSSNKYKKASLYVDNIRGKNTTEQDIDWDGSLYDFNSSKRGTVQHLRYEGTGADAYIDDSSLNLRVNCRENAEKLSEKIKYSLAVTFEIIDNTTINIYNEIRQRIAQKIRI
jgi:hypothetical protein